jgi:ribose/xylose/arabinose/galactoside ABC-type transport system permease subunit
VLVVLIVLFSVLAPDFATGSNLLNLLIQISIPGVIALGMTFPIINASFDLSVGSTMYFASLVAIDMERRMGFAPSLVLALFAGALVGGINGLLITRARINAFIVTLSTMLIVSGLALLYNDGKPIVSVVGDYEKYLGQGGLLRFPNAVAILFALFALTQWLLTQTRFGRNIYATGGNAEVTRLTGISIRFYTFMVFVISGTCAALGGTMLAGRLGTGTPPIINDDTPLAAIAAAVIGGTSLVGGVGSALRTLLGVLFMGILFNGLNLLQVSSSYQKVTLGLIVMVVVGFDSYYRKKMAA